MLRRLIRISPISLLGLGCRGRYPGVVVVASCIAVLVYFN